MSTFTRFDKDASIRYAMRASSILDNDYYNTTEAFVYHIEDYPSNITVKVPAGYLTDGATIPRALWSFASPIGKHAQAAILHDYLCEYLTIIVDGHPTRIDRKTADLIFKESLLVLGVSKFKAHAMYLGVSLYRKVTGVNRPTFNMQKRMLEDTIRAGLLDERCSKGDDACRLSVNSSFM